jgi:Tol biopolymer transport system component
MRHLSATISAKNTLWMCVALAAGILAAFLVVVLGTPTKPAEAAFPGKNGKIAFDSQLGGSDSEIFTMNANGNDKSQLTNNRTHDSDPAFSPTGRKIAFNHNGDIFTMRANGTHKKRVTTSESPDRDPSWSPDGTRIAFDSRRNGNTDIYVINQDGSGLTRITTSPQGDPFPAWSPDGTRIAFQRATPNGDVKIYVMKAAPESETNIPQRLTTTSGPNVSEYVPSWSPNGTRIAFASNQSGNGELYSVRADGSDLIQLTTNNFKSATLPAWSPDGTKIAFSGRRETDGTFGLFVMKAKPESVTNRPKRLTLGGFAPDWQPLR